MDYLFLGIGTILILLISFITALFLISLGVLHLHRYYQHKYAEDHLDEEVAKHMGYKNYPFMDMYDD